MRGAADDRGAGDSRLADGTSHEIHVDCVGGSGDLGPLCFEQIQASTGFAMRSDSTLAVRLFVALC